MALKYLLVSWLLGMCLIKMLHFIECLYLLLQVKLSFSQSSWSTYFKVMNIRFYTCLLFVCLFQGFAFAIAWQMCPYLQYSPWLWISSAISIAGAYFRELFNKFYRIYETGFIYFSIPFILEKICLYLIFWYKTNKKQKNTIYFN